MQLFLKKKSQHFFNDFVSLEFFYCIHNFAGVDDSAKNRESLRVCAPRVPFLPTRPFFLLDELGEKIVKKQITSIYDEISSQVFS